MIISILLNLVIIIPLNCSTSGIFDTKGGDEADDRDEQTESAAGELAECNVSFKMEMRVEVMR